MSSKSQDWDDQEFEMEGEANHHWTSPLSPSQGFESMSLNSPPNRPEDGKKRTRTSKACMNCSKHKKKCDGNQPCSTCSVRGIPCEYANTGKKRGPPPGRERVRPYAEYVASLEDKLQKMEEMVNAASLLAGSAQSPIIRQSSVSSLASVTSPVEQDPPMIPSTNYRQDYAYYQVDGQAPLPSHTVEVDLRVAYDQLLVNYNNVSLQLEAAEAEIYRLNQHAHELSARVEFFEKMHEKRNLEPGPEGALSPGSSGEENATVFNKI